MSKVTSSLDVIATTCNDFNRNVKELLNTYGEQLQWVNNSDIRVTKRYIRRLVDVDPTSLINGIGPYLLKYGDHITNEDDKFFLETDFTTDIKMYYIPDPTVATSKRLESDIRTTITMVERAKKKYVQLDKHGKSNIMVVLSDMLSDYCKYRMHVDKR